MKLKPSTLSFKTLKNSDEQPTYLRTLRADFDPSPLKDCEQCQGHGYTIHAKSEFATGKICSCIPICSRCGDSGMLKRVENGIERAGRCRCQKLPDRIELLGLAKIPARYGKYSFAEFDFEQVEYTTPFLLSTWLSHFQKEQSNGFVLTGGVGRGKTHLMIAACKYLIFQYGLSIRFIEFSRLLAELKRSFSQKKSIDSLMEELIRVDILAIDELGKGRCSDWELSVIDELISRRYNAMKLLVCTTNYPWSMTTGRATPNLASQEFEQSLADRIGQRAFSRLQEVNVPIKVQGLDYRSLATEVDLVINPQLRF